MIKEVKDNIFDPFFNVKINPANKVGIAGAGLSLEFKNRYPSYYEDYKEKCNPLKKYNDNGYMYSFKYHPGEPSYIFTFFTKEHWKDKSNLELIEKGAKKLQEELSLLDIGLTVAIPRIGCGLGGLKWEDVEPILSKHLINNKYQDIYYVY